MHARHVPRRRRQRHPEHLDVLERRHVPGDELGGEAVHLQSHPGRVAAGRRPWRSGAVGLDFGFASQQAGAGVPPQWTTRIDAALEFSRDCQQVTGTFDLRFYDVPDDPLAALTTAPNGSDTLIGRRLQVP